MDFIKNRLCCCFFKKSQEESSSNSEGAIVLKLGLMKKEKASDLKSRSNLQKSESSDGKSKKS
jgi:hypothetical protein